jgi:flagellar biosynthesis protein FliR
MIHLAPDCSVCGRRRIGRPCYDFGEAEQVDVLSLGLGQAQIWLLFLLRAAGFCFVAPILSSRVAPAQLRIALTVFLAMVSFLAWAPLCTLQPGMEMGVFLPAAASEIILGLLLGFLVGLLFMAFQFAGQLIGYQMGFAIVNVLDPNSQTQVSLVSEFLFACVTLSFLSLNLHHEMIGVWYQSYQIAPPGSFALTNLSLPVLTACCDDIFYLSLKIAMPLLAFLLLTDLALGIVARVMPQMNVFIVGIPLKIALGLIVLALVILQFDPAVRQVTLTFVNHAGEMLSALSGKPA